MPVHNTAYGAVGTAAAGAEPAGTEPSTGEVYQYEVEVSKVMGIIINSLDSDKDMVNQTTPPPSPPPTPPPSDDVNTAKVDAPVYVYQTWPSSLLPSEHPFSAEQSAVQISATPAQCNYGDKGDECRTYACTSALGCRSIQVPAAQMWASLPVWTGRTDELQATAPTAAR